jgi:X-X-X-Leu-X-X-Gly heptad repeat protein
VSDLSVEVHGIEELAAGTKQLADNIEQAADDAFGRVTDQTAGRVRGSVPRLTGQLAASVTSGHNPASVSMGDGVPYARFVEYGGRGHPHSPEGNYLYPAAMAARPLIEQAGEQAAETEIGQMRWPTPT